MIYIVDLTTVLKSLFDVRLTQTSRSSASTTWSELKGAFNAYENSGSLRKIHHRIRVIFQQDRQEGQVVDLNSFQRTFSELVKDEGPDWVRKRAKDWNAQDPRVPTLPTPQQPTQPRCWGIRIPCLCP
jgi:hypothetical protein